MPTKKGYNTRSMSAQDKAEMKADKAKAVPPKKAKSKPKRK